VQLQQQEIMQPEISNWPGYSYPLAFRQLKSSDAFHLYPVMKRSAKSLKHHLGWAKYAPSWDFKTVQKFVDDHVHSELPRFHFIFTIGYEVVGFGSLAPMSHLRDIQVSLWVGIDHQGRGIGSWIVTVLEWYAFHVFGYDYCYYQHDSSNRKSGKLAKRLGYRFVSTFDEEKSGTLDSGFWYSHVKPRPPGLPPGAIDTGTLENWETITFPWKCLI
jgi:RimJ/RimL family protein N-acetyltransferase